VEERTRYLAESGLFSQCVDLLIARYDTSLLIFFLTLFSFSSEGSRLCGLNESTLWTINCGDVVPRMHARITS